jgi:hypothetical protein
MIALKGFRFELKSGNTVLQTATSDASGQYTFNNVNPGSYTVHEVGETGWRQTLPVGNGDRNVTVALGSSPTDHRDVLATGEDRPERSELGNATRATLIDCGSRGRLDAALEHPHDG